MNTRAKGQRHERSASEALTRNGYSVFRLYQPPYAPQGVLDLIAVGHDRIRFIQVRSNQYHDLRPLKVFHQLHAMRSLTPTVEVWVYKDGQTEAAQRVLE